MKTCVQVSESYGHPKLSNFIARRRAKTAMASAWNTSSNGDSPLHTDASFIVKNIVAHHTIMGRGKKKRKLTQLWSKAGNKECEQEKRGKKRKKASIIILFKRYRGWLLDLQKRKQKRKHWKTCRVRGTPWTELAQKGSNRCHDVVTTWTGSIKRIDVKINFLSFFSAFLLS